MGVQSGDLVMLYDNTKSQGGTESLTSNGLGRMLLRVTLASTRPHITPSTFMGSDIQEHIMVTTYGCTNPEPCLSHGYSAKSTQ